MYKLNSDAPDPALCEFLVKATEAYVLSEFLHVILRDELNGSISPHLRLPARISLLPIEISATAASAILAGVVPHYPHELTVPGLSLFSSDHLAVNTSSCLEASILK